MIEFTPAIAEGFKAYKKGNCIASDNAMCMQLDIPRSTYANWIKGRSKTIHPDLWAKIEPQIKPYINFSATVKDYDQELKEQAVQYLTDIENEPDEVVILKLTQEIMALRQTVKQYQQTEKKEFPRAFYTLDDKKQDELLSIFNQIVAATVR